MVSKFYGKVDGKECVACGACTKECMKNAIQIWKGCYALIDAEKCIGCGKCVAVCPTGCIERVSREVSNEKEMV